MTRRDINTLRGLVAVRTALNTRRRTIVQAFSAALRLIAVAGLLGLGSGVATAETGRLVYLRTAFSAEGQPIRTTACLQVTERRYPQTAWWEDPGGTANAPERALKAVIAAIKHKDRAALLKLAHPTQGRDPKRFDEQVDAFFQQFGVIELVAMPRAYAFDGLVVFFAKLRSKEETAFAPFIFASQDDGSFGFLPYRTTTLTYRLVQDWFDSTWRAAATTNPTYCAQGDIKRATHRISLGPSPGAPNQAWRPSQLFLVGAPVDRPGEVTNLVARAKSTIENLKSALATGGDFVRYMTPEGGRRLTDWFASADPTDRRKYTSAVTEQQPFFLFDASPLVVVYTRSRLGVQVMYFTLNVNKELLWTNSSYIVEADKVYKQGPLYNAALLDKPFSSIAIK